MTFKLIYNLDLRSLQTHHRFLPGGILCSPVVSPNTYADLCSYITGCKMVAQLSNPACRHALFYLCVLWGFSFFFFFFEPTFKNQEFHIIHILAFLEKTHNLATLFHPHMAATSLEVQWGVAFWMKVMPFPAQSRVTPCVSGSEAVSTPFIIKLTALFFSWQ